MGPSPPPRAPCISPQAKLLETSSQLLPCSPQHARSPDLFSRSYLASILLQIMSKALELCSQNRPSSFKNLTMGEIYQRVSLALPRCTVYVAEEGTLQTGSSHAWQGPGDVNIFIFSGLSS